MFNVLVDKTYLYSSQKTADCINTSRPEIENPLGTYLRMGLYQVPIYVALVNPIWNTH